MPEDKKRWYSTTGRFYHDHNVEAPVFPIVNIHLKAKRFVFTERVLSIAPEPQQLVDLLQKCESKYIPMTQE